MARRKDQAARREQLTQAALRAIATHGLAKLTLSRVADEAGISPRLIAYYYPDLDSLVEAAHERATERYYGARQRATDSRLPPRARLARLMYTGLPRGDDRLLSQALDEIAVSASRSPLHAALVSLLFEREVSLYRHVLEAGGQTGEFTLSDEAEVLARGFVLLEDSLGLHLVATSSTLRLEQAERQLSGYARLATGVDVAPERADVS